MPIINRFDHATIAVRELSPAVASYEALFGAPPVWRGEHVGVGTEGALFACWNGLVELVAPRPGDGRAPGLCERLRTAGPGLFALAFGTDDADACFVELRGRSVPVAQPESGQARAEDGRVRGYRTLALSPRRSRSVPAWVVERPDHARLAGTDSVAPDAIAALDHVVVRSADPDATRAFYGADLGLRLALERDFNGVRMLFFRVGGVTVEVVEDQRAGGMDDLYGLAYRVQDVEACHDRLANLGVDVSEVRAG